MTGATPPAAFGGVAPVSIYPCGKAPWPARGPDDDDQDEAHKPAGWRPVLAGNRAELSPSARGEREPFGLNCDRAVAGRVCHPKGRSAAEDGAAVDAAGLRTKLTTAGGGSVRGAGGESRIPTFTNKLAAQTLAFL